MEKIIVKNWITNLLSPAMKENGCPSEIRTEEDVLTNLYYLSKEDSRGSRYIPLQYKRMIEKIVFGLFNTSFEYTDKEDVYFEKIGDVTVCCANVYLVSFAEDGTKKVLGHGFHCLSLNEVMPGVFMDESERTSKWKSTVIGGAKSRALYDAGIGLEFYGDVFTPEENLDEKELPKEEKREAAPSSEKTEEKKYSKSGMPIPKPKKAAKESEPDKNELAMKLGKKYFSIHRCETGFDYSFYDLSYHLLDGGVLENPDLTIKAASEEILKDAGLSAETIKGVSFEDLEDRVQKAAAITPETELPVVETKPEAVKDKEEDMSIEIAKAISADCGNYQGMTLGDIYETAPKNLVFLVRNSKDENVRKAAKVIVCSDPELKEKYAG
ncbi:LPD16 domain-containing protein [Butyrivibrio sp. AC2005]|uniref:LPD16 domain-containing protein n=1 Tax=Butyrivibrio sp. AC2005 TaxID=1280672 RepID=UPI0003F62585|nr:LPD16 domain-containing protein [Butyrivibrio sp. AC2005]